MFDLGDLRYKVQIDSKDAQNDIGKLDSKMAAFGQNASRVGGQLTRSLTLPIVGLTTVAVKLASDFEVATRKFNTAFAGTGDKANQSIINLNKNFGLASSTATQLLANTGDILKGFGATGNEALTLSAEIQKVAVALGAYNGASAKNVSEALTSAITGEREAMKQYGVIISETAVQQTLLANGTANLTGEQLLLAKAQATLQIATAQSGDAIASFTENQGTLAFQTSALLADLKDLGVEFGTILIPIAKQLTEGFRELVKWFGDLDETTKKTILIMAGLAAVIPPIIAGIGAISTAIAFLSANPIILVAAAVAVLTTAIVKNQLEAKKMREEQEALVKATDALKQNIPALVSEYSKLKENTEKTNEETARQIELENQIKELLPDVTDAVLENKDALLEQAIAQQEANKQTLESIILDTKATIEAETKARNDSVGKLKEQIQAQYNLTNALYQTDLQQAEFAARLADAETFEDFNSLAQEVAVNIEDVGFKFVVASENIARLNPLLEDAEKELERVNAESLNTSESIDILDESMDNNTQTVNDWTKAWNTYNEQIALTGRSRESGYISEKEAIEENISATKSYIETLLEAGAGGQNTNSIWANDEIAEGIVLIKQLEAELEALQDASSEVADFEKAWHEKRLEQTDFRVNDLQREELEAINQAKSIGAEILDIEEYYAEERKRIRDEEQADRIDQAMEWVETAVGFAQDISSAIYEYNQNIRDQELQDLEHQLETESVTRQNAYNAELTELQQRYENGLITQDEYNTEAEKLAKELAQAEADAAWALTQAKYEADKQAFKSKQEMAYADIWISTAMAVARAWADNEWVTALIVSGLALAGGIAQTAVVSNQVPPGAPVKPPVLLANGGIANNPGAGVNAIVGEAGAEAILPLNDNTFEMLGNAIADARGINEPTENRPIINVNVPLELDGNVISRTVIEDYVNTNNYIITQEMA